MVTLARWYDDPQLADVWDTPDTDYLGELAALNNERFATLHAEEEALVVLDEQAADDWIASRDNDYDVSEEVA